MNLKEAFRYQKFLTSLLNSASGAIISREHMFKTTKEHLKRKANPEAEDMIEVVDTEDFVPNDTVIDFMLWIVGEKDRLTVAINEAKRKAPIDIDAALEANKARQEIKSRVAYMLTNKASARTERGTDYRFNAEGNQIAYFYDIIVTTEDNFDRARAKETIKMLGNISDRTSAEIDAALINTDVSYITAFSVNDTFEDIIAEFAERMALSEDKT